MDCPKVRKYLALYLDSEFGPETTFEIASHLEECDSCRRAADQEARLETHITDALRRTQPGDDAIWATALRAAQRMNSRRSGPSPRVIGVMSVGLAAAATVALLIGGPWSHHELDLAAATAAAHTKFMEKTAHTHAATGDLHALEAYFRESLSPDFALGHLDPAQSHLDGGNLCNVGGARVAHLVLTHGDTPVSIFWMTAAALGRFPETIARMTNEGPAITCSVPPYQFYARRTGDAVLTGVGAISAEDLRRTVDALSASP